jgi:hypothetical protein
VSDADARLRVIVEAEASDMAAVREFVSHVPSIKETGEQHTLELRDIKGRLSSVEVRLGFVETDLKELKSSVTKITRRLSS